MNSEIPVRLYDETPRLDHTPNPQHPLRTLCGRRIDDTPTLTPDRIAELPVCGRCQKASTA